jgi:ATP-dependent HslUV protease subunit HslV
MHSKFAALLSQGSTKRWSKMSTIVAVTKDGFAAIAADSLTTWGSAKDSAEYVSGNQKIIQVGDSYLAISGPASAKLALKDYFGPKSDVDLTSVDAIFVTWLELHAALKKQYFLDPHENESDAFESTRLDVLIANPAGIFGVSAHRAVQQFSKFYAYGSGWQHALGAMYAVYPQPGRPAEEIARIGIAAAAEFDTDTGLPVVSHTLPLAR